MNIDLETTVFEFAEVVSAIERRAPFIKNGEVILLPDFGSFLVGNPSPEDIDLFLHPVDGEVMFTVPADWRMPNLLKALGAFDSISRAMKNGWNFDLPEGFSQFVVKINRIKGVITILKVI